MHVNWHSRRGLTLAATAALLTMTACASAAADSSSGTHAARGGNHPTPGGVRTAPGGGTAVGTATATPGWRTVETYGPDRRPVSGLLTAVSASNAWAVWTGSISVVEHWTSRAWRPVTLPPKIASDVFWPVAIGADSAGDVWLFSATHPTEAIRLTGGKWVVQPIPAWVLRPSSGTISATTAVFGPRNVWVFSLGAGAYAAHYNGHTWAKVRMPEVPVEVSAQAPDDIWALGPDISFVMHWNGVRWVRVGLELLPLPYGATVSYSNITAAGPKDAWLMRTITYKSFPVPTTRMLHWNGSTWLTVASPADVVGSLVPDGRGGLWADGIDINPGGFWYFYHLAGGHWHLVYPPHGVFPHSPEELTWIPGTRSVWAMGSNFNAKGYYGVILKYGP